MLVIERIKWRKEEEERKKQWKLKEKELAKLRLQVNLISSKLILEDFICKLWRKIRNGEKGGNQ